MGGAPDSREQAIGLITIARAHIYMATQPPYMGSQGQLLYTHIKLIKQRQQNVTYMNDGVVDRISRGEHASQPHQSL